MKGFLRGFERLAMLAVVLLLATVLSVALGLVDPATVQPIVVSSFVFVFPALLVIILLGHEFLDVLRMGQPRTWSSRNISNEELKMLVTWCPRPILYASLCCAALAMAAALPIGIVRWNFGEEFTQRHAVGFSLITTVFLSLCVPVLASASRMPGRFSDHFSGGKQPGKGGRSEPS